MYSKNEPESIKKLFDNIADRYDFLNNIISFGLHKRVRNKALKLLQDSEYEKILDLCSGTGDIALLLSNKFPQAEITGGDFSAKMLEIAQNKSKGMKNIRFEQTDATELNYQDNTFDLCTIFFGLRNLPDTTKALRGINRVLKANGEVLITDIVKPKSRLVNFYFERVMPKLASLFTTDKEAYKYLTESRETYPSHEELTEILKQNNFKVIRQKEYCFGLISTTLSKKETP